METDEGLLGADAAGAPARSGLIFSLLSTSASWLVDAINDDRLVHTCTPSRS